MRLLEPRKPLDAQVGQFSFSSKFVSSLELTIIKALAKKSTNAHVSSKGVKRGADSVSTDHANIDPLLLDPSINTGSKPTHVDVPLWNGA